jgi:hypothetical protein
LAKAEVIKFRDSKEVWREVSEQLGDRANDMAKELQKAIEDYFTQLKEWVNGSPAEPGVSTAFEPDMLGAPMLNFFPQPYEWSLRRDESIGDILMRERAQGVGQTARDGRVIINNTPPFN